MLSKIKSIREHFMKKVWEPEPEKEPAIVDNGNVKTKEPRPRLILPPPRLGPRRSTLKLRRSRPVKLEKDDPHRVEGKSLAELLDNADRGESLATRAFRRARERDFER